MNKQSAYYQLGKRDALAELLTIGRSRSSRGADLLDLMSELATAMLKLDPDHPHAKWWIKRASQEWDDPCH